MPSGSRLASRDQTLCPRCAYDVRDLLGLGELIGVVGVHPHDLDLPHALEVREDALLRSGPSRCPEIAPKLLPHVV